MKSKTPFDMSELMSQFQPENIAKMFDVEKMRAAFDPTPFLGLNLQPIAENSQRNYKAMIAANQAAVKAFKTYSEMQQRVYQDMMKGASEAIQMDNTGSPAEIAKRHSEIYAAAMEKCLSLMTELAAVTKQANEEAHVAIQAQVKEAVESMKKAK